MNKKKLKNKNKKSEDLPPQKKDNIIDNDDFDNYDDVTDSSVNNLEHENNICRKHTKFVKKKKKEKEVEVEVKEENTNIQKKVKFGKIDIIEVECWKNLNLKLTSEENMDELYKISEGKENKRLKNIGCTCIII